MSVVALREPYLIHAIPGRVRIYLPIDARLQPCQVEMRLHQMQGVRKATFNPLTGSALVHYDPLLTNSADILATLRQLASIRHGPSSVSRWSMSRDTPRPAHVDHGAATTDVLFKAAGLIAGIILADSPIGLALSGLEIVGVATEIALRRPARRTMQE